MEKVRDKIMYQVATDRNYRVGDILEFGKELNGQGQRALRESNKEWAFAVRELALEKARRDTDTDLPSRFYCMFLTDKKENALRGLKEFWTKGRGGKYFQAVAVKLNGILFVGDGRINAFPDWDKQATFEKCYNNGVRYWRGEKSKNDNRTGGGEFLFTGRAEVIEIVGEYTHI
jgi:hypothetical protein